MNKVETFNKKIHKPSSFLSHRGKDNLFDKSKFVTLTRETLFYTSMGINTVLKKPFSIQLTLILAPIKTPQLLMNIAFSKILKINDRLWEFNFRRIKGEYPSYYADVTNESGVRIPFSIYKSADGTWRATSHKLPLWIASAEALIGETIEETEKEMMSKKRA